MKIICIGLNYLDHVEQLACAVPEQPLVFLKPDTALLRNNADFYYPSFTKELVYEVELVIKIAKIGRSIDAKFASRYYTEIGLGIDFTARDLFRKQKEAGLAWEISKAFDHAAPVSPVFVPIHTLRDSNNINFRLDINQQTVQSGTSSRMVFSFDQIIAHVSQFMTLKIGDLIFTGTPAGVDEVKIGDQLQAYLEDQLLLDFQIK